MARYSALDETLNSDPCFRQCESSPRSDAKPMRRSRGSVRLDDADDEADFDDDEADFDDEADGDADDEADADADADVADVADADDEAGFDDDEAPDAPDDCDVRVDCASARDDDRRLLIVGTSTAANVIASDTKLTTRRWRGDPRRPIVPQRRTPTTGPSPVTTAKLTS